MKGYFFLAFNILVTIALFAYLYDPDFEYTLVIPHTECLNFQPLKQALCAQCITKTSFNNYHKGLVLQHPRPYSILQLRKPQPKLTCRELIHLIDYTDPTSKTLYLDKIGPLVGIIWQLRGSMEEMESHRNIVQGGFQDVVVFGWYDMGGEKGVKIQKVNEQNISRIIHFYFYLLNFMVFTIILGKLINPQKHIPNTQTYVLISLILLLEAYTSPIPNHQLRHILLQLIRLLTFTFALQRTKINKLVIAGYLVLGLVLLWHPLTLAIYAYLSVLLIVMGSFDKSEIKQFWIYIFVTQLLLSVNYLIWFLMFRHQSDSTCRIIELSQLIFNLLAFALIEDQQIQTFKEYHQNEIKGKDPQLKPIHLGQQQEDEIVIRV